MNWANEIPDDQYYKPYGAPAPYSSSHDSHIHTGDPREDLDYDRRNQYATGMDYIVPAEVRNFVLYLHQAIQTKNMSAIHDAYNIEFNSLTERYFQKEQWPTDDYIAPLVNGDETFMILYKELYYRHYYARVKDSPELDVRNKSYDNYIELFNYVLNASEPVDLELPNQWLWDIIDEFIYQFQSFSVYRNKMFANVLNQYDTQQVEELNRLETSPKLWNVFSVLNVLHSLIDKSSINQQLEVYSSGGNPESVAGEFGSHPLYKMLGYFSLVGLLRLHCLLGDYYQALKVLENIDFNKKNMYSAVPSSQITTFYYVGFAYLMMRRYQDAIRTFTDVLLFISHTEQMFPSKTQLYDQVNKLAERIYTLLAICLVLHPMSIDESINSTLRKKYTDKMLKMQKGDMDEFKNSYHFGSPRFVYPVAPYISDENNFHIGMDPHALQLGVFLEEVQHQLLLPVIRSYLKLYTTLPVSKLAAFLDVRVEDLCRILMCFKHKMKNLVWKSGSNGLDGEFQSASEVDFYIDGDMIHVADTKVAKRYGDFFIRQIHWFDEVANKVQKANVKSSS